MLMESDKNPLPQFDLFPRTMRVVHFIFDQLRDPGLSDHARGSGPALDRALYEPTYEQPDLFERTNRWDSEGRDLPEGY